MAQEKFQAVLSGVPGGPYQITSVSISFSRDTSPDGRPSSMVYGGQIALASSTTTKASLAEAMINAQNKPFGDGSIAITTAQQEGVFRTISFKKGYIVNYTEAFDMQGGGDFQCQFTISAEEITVGTAKLINKWPTVS